MTTKHKRTWRGRVCLPPDILSGATLYGIWRSPADTYKALIEPRGEHCRIVAVTEAAEIDRLKKIVEGVGI